MLGPVEVVLTAIAAADLARRPTAQWMCPAGPHQAARRQAGGIGPGPPLHR
ncbi:hypothetical protein GCM10009524_17970 [Spirilliplanes yamanashiensis]